MKTIRDFDFKNKKVIIRVDFNVPIKDNKIIDDTRIKESLKTINYVIDNGGKVLLMSHLGRIKTEEDKKNNSLKIVSDRLSELLNKKVYFIENTRNIVFDKDIMLMENTRFEDIDGEKESKNDPELGKYWASLGEIFINDAFGTSHRAHASNVGIASHLPSGIGFLIEKELKNLDIKNTEKPLTIILGGAKVKDKIGVIKNLSKKADYILIGGGMAFTFLKAEGINIGNSLVDNENIDFCKEILNKYPNKIILPIDVVTEDKECFINEIGEDEMGLDIGKKTVRLFKQYLETSKTIIWNGPVGKFEDEKYSNGTKELCKVLEKIDCVKIAGGGDTVSAINNFGYNSAFTHLSTGGGASLELLEGKELPGIEIIK